MNASWLVTWVALIFTILSGLAALVQFSIWLKQFWPNKDGWCNVWLTLKKSRIFFIIIIVFITSLLIFGFAKAWECYHSNCPDICVFSYRDFHLENVSIDEKFNKAIIYGSMSRSICVPSGKTRLTLDITIPSNGWGEGLAGPADSFAEIKVDNKVKYERIIADQNHYHHGWYYRYEYGDHFLNMYDVTGKNNVVLVIRLVGGAHMDFKQITSTFE